MAQRKPREASPGEQVASLAATLSQGAPQRAVVLRGDERWFREDALRHALDAARRAAMEIEKYDASDPDFNARSLTDALLAPPMFAAARCIVVRNAAALFKKDAGNESSVTRAVLGFLKDADTSGFLVLDAEGLRADHAVVKAAVAAGGLSLGLRRLYDSPPPWDNDPRKTEVMQWLTARARERKIPLTPDDALYVATATGNDLYQLDAALERLSHKTGGSVKGMIAWSAAGSPFDVAEFMLRGEVARSVAGIEALFKLGFADKSGEREIDRGALLAITLGALRNKLRASVAAARVIEHGGDVESAVAASGTPAYAKAREEFTLRMRARAPRAWRGLQEDLAELERRTRRGGTTDANDLCALALRWRVAAGARPAPVVPGRASAARTSRFSSPR
ncbi:MAG: hypothetical protein JNL28_04040 [Planctomycetes bacterium]|nr:hypothetical protein [Planctomycetota bacterium]